MNVVQFRNGTYGVRRKRWFRYQFLAHRSALGGDEWRTTDIMIPHSDFEYPTREDAEFRMSKARRDGPDVGEIVPAIDGYQPIKWVKETLTAEPSRASRNRLADKPTCSSEGKQP